MEFFSALFLLLVVFIALLVDSISVKYTDEGDNTSLFSIDAYPTNVVSGRFKPGTSELHGHLKKYISVWNYRAKFSRVGIDVSSITHSLKVN